MKGRLAFLIQKVRPEGAPGSNRADLEAGKGICSAGGITKEELALAIRDFKI